MVSILFVGLSCRVAVKLIVTFNEQMSQGSSCSLSYRYFACNIH